MIKTQPYTYKDTMIIGLMMFALFLGAGNLIFPPLLGQEAGTSVWSAVAGFLVTGVGLPILAIIAIAKSGGDLQQISGRVGKIFGLIFPFIVYLAIGPLFGIPRTGSVAFEIGILPYLDEGMTTFPLFIFTIIFLGISYWLSLNPSKLVPRIGKVLTPILVITLLTLTVAGIVSPIGFALDPINEYTNVAFFTGFQEGFFTMDAIGALVFGTIVITRMKERGLSDRKRLIHHSVQVAFIAGVGLVFVYISLAYLGSTSVSILGYQENGGLALTSISRSLLGSTGLVLLSLIITIACLTTAVGLISAFGEYISKTIPSIPYVVSTGCVALFSLIMANMGLTQLIQFSLPILIIIYPIAIVLIILTLLDTFFHGRKEVYAGAVFGTAIISISDGLIAGGVMTEDKINFLSFFPFTEQGLAWILPAILGAAIGFIYSGIFQPAPSKKIN
ncbi:branched-chain amino acid transport system II carrier protein [Salipaludibacillus sp. CF4.18]|uniref:branched-chain amino acid transport system II carrier protein n=1 Tax=Salipaludibacillus sp. CF4.18 TaxID=3373081 RepID=UPI003EE7BF41